MGDSDERSFRQVEGWQGVRIQLPVGSYEMAGGFALLEGNTRSTGFGGNREEYKVRNRLEGHHMTSLRLPSWAFLTKLEFVLNICYC